MNLLNPYEAIFEKLNKLEGLLYDRPEFQNPPEYLLVQQAAEFISSTANALRVMVHKHQVPFIKKHGKLFFKKSDLIEWLESGRVNIVDDLQAEDILVVNKKGRK